MKKLTLAAVTLAVVAFAGGALADEPGKITLNPQTIYGRAARPSVVVEVQRATMKLPLKDLTQPSAAAVTTAAKKEPF